MPGEAYLDAIGIVLDLKGTGCLGLLVLARGRGNGRQLVPESFVRELETKQTQGMLVTYNGPDDGTIARDPH